MCLHHVNALVRSLSLRGWGDQPESHRNRLDGHGEIPVPASLRGNQCSAIDLHHRWNHDSEKKIKKSLKCRV